MGAGVDPNIVPFFPFGTTPRATSGLFAERRGKRSGDSPPTPMMSEPHDALGLFLVLAIYLTFETFGKGCRNTRTKQAGIPARSGSVGSGK